MNYVLYFCDAGAPKTGLTPLVTIYKKVADGADVTPAPTITEIGGGFYKFAAAPAEALVVRVDAGGALGNADRYKVIQVTPHDGDLDAQVSTRAPESGGNVAAIKTKTDTLPSDPASNTQVNTRLSTSSYTPPDNVGISAIKAKTDNLPAAPASEGNVQGHVANALAAYDPPTKAELDGAVAPLALEAGIEAHVLAVLNSYDPPTRAEALTDKEAILAAIAALNDMSVGELLGGDLSDSLSFPANSLADLMRKLFWVVCNHMVIEAIGGVFTAYKTDGVTPAAAGTITENGVATTRSKPTWL
jgi:hypothetical protein